MPPLVSISCITYNHACFLRECFEGFLLQKTSFPIEILVHDDGSTDGSKDIIEEYCAKYPNLFFPVFQTENLYSKGVRGIMARFNFPRARGKYMALCEGDDYWTDPYKLQKQVDLLETNPHLSGTYTDTLVLRENQLSPWREYLKPITTIKDVISLWAPFHTSSFLYRSSCFTLNDPHLFSGISSGDMLLFTLIAATGDLAKVDCQPTVYRKHEGGITNHTNNLSYSLHLNRILLWEKVKVLLPAHAEQLNHVIAQHLLEMFALSEAPMSVLLDQIGHQTIIQTIGKKNLLKKILFP